MRYYLNSAVITNPGTYEYHLVSIDQAKEWDTNGVVQSTIGYEQTADALNEILGHSVPISRTTIKMQPKDEALVFRLVFPQGSPRIDPADKGRLKKEIIEGHFELGILIRLS